VSNSADHLIRTALLLMQHTSAEDNFLQVHGGLHYGKILKRNNNYFGTTINFASRIAHKANAGTFWCSEDYINALTDSVPFNFQSMGQCTFKNLSENRELFELKIDRQVSFHIDPVCRMLINDPKNAISHLPENIFFCSQDCYKTYLTKKEN
jgi:class 3 adenylate cyclase